MRTPRRLSEAEFRKQIHDGAARSEILQKSEPRAKSAKVVAAGRALHIELTNHGVIEIPFDLMPELDEVSLAQLKDVEVDPLGKGLLWRKSGIGLDFSAILERVFGTAFRSAAARHLGRRTSKAKAAAARTNGLKGGRPRKTVTITRARVKSPPTPAGKR